GPPIHVIFLIIISSLLFTDRAFAATPAAESPLDQALESAAKDDSATAPSRDSAADRPDDGSQSAQQPGNMIAAFIKSWQLFKFSYVEGGVCGLLLAIVGVVVVARDQIFIGAAVSEASTLGIAVALCLGGAFPVHKAESWLPHSVTWFCCDGLQPFMAVA